MRRIVALFIAGGLSGLAMGCGGATDPDLEFADWVFPVAEGIPVKEYGPVMRDGRVENAVELIEDLVIGGDPADPSTAFYRPLAVVAAANGNIFVVDNGNARVQMFSAEGQFLKTLGQRGQGPGEFQMPMAATIAGEHLIVTDSQNSRFSVWTDEGEHVADHATPLGFQALRMAGLESGGMVILGPEVDMTGLAAGSMPQITNVLASYSSEGEQLVRFIEATTPQMGNPMEFMNDARARVQFMIDMSNVPTPAFTVGADDTVYVTPTSEYQILAMNAAGETTWALRVAWPRPPFSEESKERRVRSLARDDPDVSVDDFDWPEFSDAISSSFLTDGYGRLYVFPNRWRSQDADRQSEESKEAEEDRPRNSMVDIYSPDGDLIVTGLMSGRWNYARGDYVYRLGSDPDSDETLVYRYRLLLNQ